MSGETDSNKEKTMNEQVDTEALRLEEAIEKIKQPSAIDDVMSELPPEELKGNPSVAPEMLDQPSDLRDDLQR